MTAICPAPATRATPSFTTTSTSPITQGPTVWTAGPASRAASRTGRCVASRSDLTGLAVEKVLIDGKRAARFGVRSGKLHVSAAARPLPDDADVVVSVRYGGNPGPTRGAWGEVGWEELTEGALVAAQPNGASTWFPCNDHPSNKATFAITLTVDSPYYVLCNGTLTSRRTGASQTTWRYEQDEPMATYLATVQVGTYEQTQLAGAPRQLAVLPNRLGVRFNYDFACQPTIMQRRSSGCSVRTRSTATR